MQAWVLRQAGLGYQWATSVLAFISLTMAP